MDDLNKMPESLRALIVREAQATLEAYAHQGVEMLRSEIATIHKLTAAAAFAKISEEDLHWFIDKVARLLWAGVEATSRGDTARAHALSTALRDITTGSVDANSLIKKIFVKTRVVPYAPVYEYRLSTDPEPSGPSDLHVALDTVLRDRHYYMKQYKYPCRLGDLLHTQHCTVLSAVQRGPTRVLSVLASVHAALSGPSVAGGIINQICINGCLSNPHSYVITGVSRYHKEMFVCVKDPGHTGITEVSIPLLVTGRSYKVTY